MGNHMPFALWLDACGDMAAIRYRLDAAGLSESVAKVSQPQQLLENGNLEDALSLLNRLADEFEPLPEIKSAVLQLIAKVESFEGVAKED